MKTRRLSAVGIGILVLTLAGPAAWASGGSKEKGDWHIKNQTHKQVIVNFYDENGQPCFSSYLDPEQKLGMPQNMQKCGFPGLKVQVKVIQQGKNGLCEVTLDKMSNVIFDGERCEVAS